MKKIVFSIGLLLLLTACGTTSKESDSQSVYSSSAIQGVASSEENTSSNSSEDEDDSQTSLDSAKEAFSAAVSQQWEKENGDDSGYQGISLEGYKESTKLYQDRPIYLLLGNYQNNQGETIPTVALVLPEKVLLKENRDTGFGVEIIAFHEDYFDGDPYDFASYEEINEAIAPSADSSLVVELSSPGQNPTESFSVEDAKQQLASALKNPDSLGDFGATGVAYTRSRTSVHYYKEQPVYYLTAHDYPDSRGQGYLVFTDHYIQEDDPEFNEAFEMYMDEPFSVKSDAMKEEDGTLQYTGSGDDPLVSANDDSVLGDITNYYGYWINKGDEPDKALYISKDTFGYVDISKDETIYSTVQEMELKQNSLYLSIDDEDIKSLWAGLYPAGSDLANYYGANEENALIYPVGINMAERHKHIFIPSDKETIMEKVTNGKEPFQK